MGNDALPPRIIWHDLRLEGDAPRLNNTYVHKVGDIDRLATSIEFIANHARFIGKLKRLDIVCHGFEDWAEDDETQSSTLSLGFGLELTADCVSANNVTTAFQPLYGLIETIVIYACGASHTSNASQYGNRGDGRTLIHRLVDATGALVVASDYIQSYDITAYGIDYGNWEGNVHGFDVYGNVIPYSRSQWRLV